MIQANLSPEQIYAHSSFDPEYIADYITEERQYRAGKAISEILWVLPKFNVNDVEEFMLLAAPKQMFGYRSDETSKVPQLAVVYAGVRCITYDREADARGQYTVRPYASSTFHNVVTGMNQSLHETLTEAAKSLGKPIPEKAFEYRSSTTIQRKTFRPAVPIR